jgi:hypothetical protein
MEKSLLAAVLAILAVSMVFVGIAATESDAAVKNVDPYDGADLPQRTIEFETTLGYEYYALSEVNPGYDHTQYWTASFDFSDSIEDGKYWPYGNDAIIAVTFYFSNGSDNDVGSIKASKTLCYPVYCINGVPYVEDVCCTPDLWPSEDNVYPVQVEAVIYTTLYNDTAANGQY